MQCSNITGGPVYEPLSKTTSKDAEYVNNSKLIDPQQDQHSSWLKEQNNYDPLHTVQWIWSLTFHWAPFQKPVRSPSWRRRGWHWSYGIQWWWLNLVPITHKLLGLFQSTFTIIGRIKNKLLHFSTILREEYNVHQIFYDW